MNFRKASIFQRDTEKSEEQNDSGGMLAVWGSPGSGKTVTAVKIAKMLSARKKNVILLLCDMAVSWHVMKESARVFLTLTM